MCSSPGGSGPAESVAGLTPVLERARRYGYLGPGPIERHITHALAMGRVVRRWGVRALDLGSGAGLPGLALALAHPTSRWVLLDAHSGRARFLQASVTELALDGRVVVVRERAEEGGRRSDLREAFAVVTARGFGPPAVTAECGSALVAVGGCLVVSEPPEPSPDRWSDPALERLGLRRSAPAEEGPARVAVLEKVAACPDWVPRRTGMPDKRPLF